MLLALLWVAAPLQAAPADSASTPGLRNAIPSQEAGPCTLLVEAGVLYRSGDAKPAARMTVHIVQGSLYKSVQDAFAARYADKPKKAQSSVWMYLNAYGSYLSGYQHLDKNERGVVAEAMGWVTQREVRSVVTGFDGKVRLESLPEGKYYIHCGWGNMVGYSPSFVLWDVPITLTPGTQTVVLDNNNAFMTR